MIQDDKVARKQDFCAKYLTKFRVDLNGISMVLRPDHRYTHCLSLSIQAKEPYNSGFVEKASPSQKPNESKKKTNNPTHFKICPYLNIS